MMQSFFKYQGTGNDFVMIDNRKDNFQNNPEDISHLCNRRFGIGADGVILLETHSEHDFKMIYFNANGQEGSMCGNGARCAVAFAYRLGIITKKTAFEAVDGLHHATIQDNHINLKMKDVDRVEVGDTYLFVDTGSPHHIVVVDDLDNYEVSSIGLKIAHGAPYYDRGTNVNFVEQINEHTFRIRTYERGVEAETLSCGTGATAVALAMFHKGMTSAQSIDILVEGGRLQISFEVDEGTYKQIYLRGDAKCVFEGKIII